ncbi:MAG: M1 family metallopeptidase [Anaerolineae bacterium]|nr:M1 family metallopeptidase [Anaerolineae bacterium]
MKLQFFWLTLWVLILSACLNPNFRSGQKNESTIPAASSSKAGQIDPGSDTGEGPLEIFREGLIESHQHFLESLRQASFYTIEYTISDSLTQIHGTQKVLYTNQENVALEEIHFRLLPNVLNGEMIVDNLQVNGESIDPIYSLQNSLMRVPLPDPLQPSESAEITLEFAVTVPTKITSNYGILAFVDGVLTLAHAYPMIAVYDDEGWNAEIPAAQGDPTYADASFFLVTVDAPEHLVLVAAGREIKREDNGSRQIVTYAAGPVRDFYMAASPDYQVITKTIGEITYNSYAPKELQAGSKMAIEVAAGAIEFFGDWLGPYPYSEFDIISTPTYALGIEYPGIIALNDRIYYGDGSISKAADNLYLEATVVHEAGHQWFYNLVGNDQLNEPWLDESLTQFVTWQYFVDKHGKFGDVGFEYTLRERWRRTAYPETPIGLPVSEYNGAEYGAIVYGRGAFFFEALRDIMGEDSFEAFIKEYVQINSWGLSTGSSLKVLAEQHCNCDLTDLYAEWVTP